jgi:hypothetical protein
MIRITYKYALLPAVIAFLGYIGFLRAGDTTAEPDVDHCVSCHQESDVLPSGFNKDDIHMQSGLSCAGCHGGDKTREDMDEAMSAKAGFIGVPKRSEIPDFCGRCHSDIKFMRVYQPRIPTDQESQYFTSIHGKRLRNGDKKVAVCINCHTSHSIFSAKDPRSTVYALNVPETCNHCHGDPEYMKDYDIPTDQYAKYAGSVHGIALLEKRDTGAPACNDCHGNHGAIPPGVSSISHVCGLCHVNNLQYFTASAMGKAFAEQNLHACEECHGNHGVQPASDDMVGTGENSVCIECHGEGDRGYNVADSISRELKSAVERYQEALSIRKDVKTSGMDDIDIGYLLQDAHQDLIQSRTLVHTFDPARVSEKTVSSLKNSEKAIKLAKSEIEEYAVRRKGLGVATIFITIIVVALFFKIRQMENKDV